MSTLSSWLRRLFGAPAALSAHASEPVGKPFFQFKHPTHKRAFLAHPCIFLAGYHHDSIQPGSRDQYGTPGIWANDTDFGPTIDWIDDPANGFFTRRIDKPEQAIGVRGLAAGVTYQFADLLQVGKNVIVYQLTNVGTGEFAVYGFPRDEVDLRHAWVKHMTDVAEGRRPFDSVEIIPLAERVLAVFPDEESASYNKGLAHLAREEFAAAHECFEMAVRVNRDAFNLLYDAAALAGLGDGDRAVTRMFEAEAAANDHLGPVLQALPDLRDSLRAAVDNALHSDALRADAARLRAAYFQT